MEMKNPLRALGWLAVAGAWIPSVAGADETADKGTEAAGAAERTAESAGPADADDSGDAIENDDGENDKGKGA